ncbi:MAG: hypothetical protein ACTSVY_06635 [Candidatus Helarchaeota archaeon]
MSAKSKTLKSKKGIDESLYEELVLHAIEKEPRRPKTIVRIIKGVLTQNEVVVILNRLEKKGKVERNSTKAWMKV